MLAYWHWVILGFSMVALEVMIPGAFFIWIGIAALILGGTTFLFPLMSLTGQLLLFGVVAPLVTVLGRKVVRLQDDGGAPATLNRRGQQFVGQTIVLDVPILNGRAHVTVADSKWSIQGPDLPAGSVVKVIGVDGNVLVVIQEGI
ncbi:MAG: NfeD family protein [Candidatus Paracaedibacter sp.]|jgi:membrane protein implicated in regulation of membrane protease activity